MNFKNLIIEFLNVLWNERNLEVIDEFVDGSASIESPLAKTVGCQGKHDVINEWFTGFSNTFYRPLEVYLEKNHVTLRWSCEGIHTGKFKNIPPTGKRINYDGLTIFTLEGGKIIKYNSSLNRIFQAIYLEINLKTTGYSIFSKNM